MKKRDIRSRRGSMLVQMLILMGIGGTLLLIATDLIHRSFDVASDYRKEYEQNNAIIDLSRQFRSDVHQSARADSVDMDQAVLTLLDGSTVRYVAAQNSIERLVSRPGMDQPTERNRYKLAGGRTARFRMDGEAIEIQFTNQSMQNVKPSPGIAAGFTLRSYISLAELNENLEESKGASDEPLDN